MSELTAEERAEVIRAIKEQHLGAGPGADMDLKIYSQKDNALQNLQGVLNRGATNNRTGTCAKPQELNHVGSVRSGSKSGVTQNPEYDWRMSIWRRFREKLLRII